jgi:hypothetical protein
MRFSGNFTRRFQNDVEKEYLLFVPADVGIIYVDGGISADQAG